MMTEFQCAVHDHLLEELRKLALEEYPKESFPRLIRSLGSYAFALYRDLILCGRNIPFSRTLLENRLSGIIDKLEIEKTNFPKFFEHRNVLDEFVGIVWGFRQKSEVPQAESDKRRAEFTALGLDPVVD